MTFFFNCMKTSPDFPLGPSFILWYSRHFIMVVFVHLLWPFVIKEKCFDHSHQKVCDYRLLYYFFASPKMTWEVVKWIVSCTFGECCFWTHTCLLTSPCGGSTEQHWCISIITLKFRQICVPRESQWVLN